MSRRALAAGGILALWALGLAVLARREHAGGQAARLTRAAFFVAPGAEYYTVSTGDRQIGFASSTIDTVPGAFQITDLVLADLARNGKTQRVSARSRVVLSRALRLRRFRYELGAGFAPYRATGTVTGDTLLTLVVESGRAGADTQRVRIPGPLYLPTMVPMVIALGERPAVGSTHRFLVFDPLTDSLSHVAVRVAAESLFVLPDSARWDPVAARWVSAHRGTVRSWRIVQDGTHGPGPLTGWIDGRGRMVEASPLPQFRIRRTAYEIAFENWSRGTSAPARVAAAHSPVTP